jgi:hypothetical protein
MLTRADPSIEQQPEWRPQSGVTGLILVGGGAVYALLCMPAIQQRGFPPIDPAWSAISFLWIAPILLSAVFDDRSIKARSIAVALYAVATAFIDSGTMISVVPHRPNGLEMVLMTLIFFGPYHLAAAFGLEAIVRGIRRLCSRIQGLSPALRSSLKWPIAGFLLALTVAAPFLSREAAYAVKLMSGRAAAERDWVEQRAEVYSPDFNERTVDGVRLVTYYDRDSGLRLHVFPTFFGYGEAYNQRINELLAEQGIPPWSMKSYLVDDKDLIAMLDSEQLEEIRDFPCELSTGIVLVRSGTFSRWGETMSSFGDSLSVATQHSGFLGVGTEVRPIYVGRNPKYPHLVFVRYGRTWLGAFHEEGWNLNEASRD